MIVTPRLAAETAAGILACLWLFQQPADTATQQKRPIDLPATANLPTTCLIQRWERLPTIVVSLNESRQERAVIATGLNADVVSPAASDRLKLPPADGRVKIDALNSSSAAGQAEIKLFRASTLELPKLVFAVADVPGLLSRTPHPDAPAAWLGTPFLSAFQLTLDPAPLNSITLQKASTKLPRPKNSTVAKLEMREGRPFVQVSVPGAKPFWALIDTSSPGTLIPTEVAEKLKVKPVKVEPVSWRDGKPGKVAVAVLPKLSIGKADWKLARVAYFTPDSSKEYDRNFAVLGMDFIGQFKVTIDFLHSQIVLSPPEKPAAPPPTGDDQP